MSIRFIFCFWLFCTFSQAHIGWSKRRFKGNISIIMRIDSFNIFRWTYPCTRSNIFALEACKGHNTIEFLIKVFLHCHLFPFLHICVLLSPLLLFCVDRLKKLKLYAMHFQFNFIVWNINNFLLITNNHFSLVGVLEHSS